MDSTGAADVYHNAILAILHAEIRCSCSHQFKRCGVVDGQHGFPLFIRHLTWDVSLSHPVDHIYTHGVYIGSIDISRIGLTLWITPSQVNPALFTRTWILPLPNSAAHRINSAWYASSRISPTTAMAWPPFCVIKAAVEVAFSTFCQLPCAGLTMPGWSIAHNITYRDRYQQWLPWLLRLRIAVRSRRRCLVHRRWQSLFGCAAGPAGS